MNSEKMTLVIPVLLIAVGTGLLLTTLGVVPEIDWTWTLGLLAVGVLVFVIGGWDKVTVVLGPFFLLASGLSVLRQTHRITWSVEVSLLVILLGLLLLISRSRMVPAPRWMIDPVRKD